LTQITAKLVAVMNAVTEKEGGLNDAHDVALVTSGPSYWATSGQAKGWGANISTLATDSPDSDLPWFEKPVISM
jgi:hypothetical protein